MYLSAISQAPQLLQATQASPDWAAILALWADLKQAVGQMQADLKDGNLQDAEAQLDRMKEDEKHLLGSVDNDPAILGTVGALQGILQNLSALLSANDISGCLDLLGSGSGFQACLTNLFEFCTSHPPSPGDPNYAALFLDMVHLEKYLLRLQVDLNSGNEVDAQLALGFLTTAAKQFSKDVGNLPDFGNLPGFESLAGQILSSVDDIGALFNKGDNQGALALVAQLVSLFKSLS